MRDTKGHTYVAVTVTIEGIAHTEIHYVMEQERICSASRWRTGQQSLQRCLVKAIAFHGLGLNVYAGEDLPMDLDEEDGSVIIEDFNKAKSSKRLTK